MKESKSLNQVIEERKAVDERIFNTPGPRFYFWANVTVNDSGGVVRRWTNFYETMDEAYGFEPEDDEEDEEYATSSLCVTDRPHLFPSDEFVPMGECVEIERGSEGF